ncbi:MAG: aldehyde ferredoxin oxidoreductase family protein [Anaerolineae bacterium]
MVKGYAGKILWVHLAEGRIWTEEPDEAFYRRYLGGAGFVAYYLLKEVPKGADPLGPENVLVFAGGAITGLPIAGSGRSAVGCKSPLTGGWGESDSGGYFGAELKRAGYDAVVVKGCAESPVWLDITPDGATLRPADHLWGLDTRDTQEAIQEATGDRHTRLAVIGTAGERLVHYACVIHDLRHAAGRTGVGAVMGSKKLKAVAVRGGSNVAPADPDALKALARWMREHWRDDAESLHDTGTDGGLMDLNDVGALPTRNFQDGAFEGAEKITGATMRDTILTGREGCFGCPIRCKRVVEIHDDDYDVDPIYGGPEYETVGSMGSNCGIDDLRAIAKAHEICNAQGLDAISAGMCVSFAMECYENGLLTDEDTGGLELRFGNAEVMVRCVELIAAREGIGELLAEGPRAAAAKIGPEALPFVIDVKGQPFPMHECRTRHGQALGYAVSPTGADHMHNYWDEGQEKDPLGDKLLELGVYQQAGRTEMTTAKVWAYTATTNWQWVHNMLGHCMFVPWTRRQMVDLVRAITGWETNLHELLMAGERCVTMARAFNLREGFTRTDDRLPLRTRELFKTERLNERPVDPEELDEAITLFYGMMGWDAETGTPLPATLHRLDIAWVAEAVA